jgi:hypothetical protein
VPAGQIGAKQAPASQNTSAAPEAPGALPDPTHSGEYPAAALYDQTLLPEPPRRRTRKTE